ncbi:zinc finger protein 143-like, partial [Scleropages formosus]
MQATMLLAQINRDSQGMAEFQAGGGEAQHVTLCLAEAVAVADGDQIESMDTVSLQAVTLVDGSTAYIQHSPKGEDSLRLEDGQAVQLEDGTTAYIHHTPKEVYDQSALQAVQLEDGTTAYIQHTVQMPQSNTILAIQADGTVSDLHADSAIDPETISVLEQYTTKIVLQSQGQGGSRNAAKAQQTGEKSFRCDYDGCGKLESAHISLSSISADSAGERPFKCPFEGCGRSFTTSNIRKVHIRTHTGERPYYCSEPGCGRAFASATNYKNHMRIHTGMYLLICYWFFRKRPLIKAIDESGVTYVPGVEEEDSGSELVSAGTPEVSISHGDMQAMADTITMVTQDGTTITVPAHEAMLSSGGAHSVTMVTADGTEGQVAIVTPDLATFQTTQAELNQEHQLVTASPHPVTLLATSNGTQIAVQ